MRTARVWACAWIVAWACLGAEPAASSEGYTDPEAHETLAATEAAVARLGAQRARHVDGAIREVSGLAQGLQAKVQSLERAKRDLGAKESDLEIRIDLPADVLFDVDSADIRSDAAQALTHLATVIRAYRGPVRLLGHTDADGTEPHNLALSKRRAESVRRWLVDTAAIDASRLHTEGFGESQPIAPNDTAQNKQRNRRVEVIIRKET